MSTPTVLLGGFAYRLNADGRMEHTRASLALVDANWFPVTERSEDGERAAAALMALAGTLPIRNGKAFYLVTGIDAAPAPAPPLLRRDELTAEEAVGFPDRGSLADQVAYLHETGVRRASKEDRHG